MKDKMATRLGAKILSDSKLAGHILRYLEEDRCQDEDILACLREIAPQKVESMTMPLCVRIRGGLKRIPEKDKHLFRIIG